eukprot:6006137-Prymnesium_polylepis.2
MVRVKVGVWRSVGKSAAMTRLAFATRSSPHTSATRASDISAAAVSEVRRRLRSDEGLGRRVDPRTRRAPERSCAVDS